MAIIFRKTAKGLAEIATRSRRLAPRVRSTLILVDGKRDGDELKLLVALHTDDALQALAAQGFIEAIGETVGLGTPAAPVSATPPATPPALFRPTIDLAMVRRQVVRAVNEQLGSSATSLALRIKKSRSAEELKPLVNQAVQLVAAARGRPAADAFATRMPVL